MALRLIAPQTIDYYASTGRVTNSIGLDVPSFADPVTLANVSVQPVDKTKYEALGLDFGKNYVTLYIQQGVISIQRGEEGGDEFIYDGVRYHLTGNTNWKPQDGWNGAICVAITDV
jgi:hypothetical protein